MLKKRKAKKKKKPDALKGEVSNEQWDEWRKHDSENVEKMYEQDLEQAILQSRIDFENKKSNTHSNNGSGEQIPNQDNEKQKRKKEKPQPMSLQQFNQLSKQSEPALQSSDENSISNKPNTKVQAADPKFFDRVTEDAGKIIQKEKLQEEYQKQYLVESARARQHREELEKRDATIQELQEKNQKLEDELKTVKKRNQQLCHILAQGEMKDKTEVLAELAELTKVKDELTSEVQQLTSELEREKSQNHKNKVELEKLKGGKHGK